MENAAAAVRLTRGAGAVQGGSWRPTGWLGIVVAGAIWHPLQVPTAAVPMENPCCSCELTRVRSPAAGRRLRAGRGPARLADQVRRPGPGPRGAVRWERESTPPFPRAPAASLPQRRTHFLALLLRMPFRALFLPVFHKDGCRERTLPFLALPQSGRVAAECHKAFCRVSQSVVTEWTQTVTKTGAFPCGASSRSRRQSATKTDAFPRAPAASPPKRLTPSACGALQGPGRRAGTSRAMSSGQNSARPTALRLPFC